MGTASKYISSQKTVAVVVGTGGDNSAGGTTSVTHGGTSVYGYGGEQGKGDAFTTGMYIPPAPGGQPSGYCFGKPSGYPLPNGFFHIAPYGMVTALGHNYPEYINDLAACPVGDYFGNPFEPHNILFVPAAGGGSNQYAPVLITGRKAGSGRADTSETLGEDATEYGAGGGGVASSINTAHTPGKGMNGAVWIYGRTL